MVRAAAATAVRASISAPVWPAVLTRDSMAIPAVGWRRSWKSTSAPVIMSGWQRGIKVWTCLAARMPASRAAASTSPLGMFPSWIRSRVSFFRLTKPRATASRLVTGLAVMSTMRAWPRASRCVSLFILGHVLPHDGVHLVLDLELQLLEFLALPVLLRGEVVDAVELA